MLLTKAKGGHKDGLHYRVRRHPIATTKTPVSQAGRYYRAASKVAFEIRGIISRIYGYRDGRCYKGTSVPCIDSLLCLITSNQNSTPIPRSSLPLRLGGAGTIERPPR